MSRTRHSLPSHSFHHMRVKNSRMNCESIIDHLSEFAGFTRHHNRIFNYWSTIPEPWDDKVNSSAKEYHNKNYWKKYYGALTQPHFTRN